MAEDRATVTIYRYDPDTDQAPWFQTFDEIPYLGMSVLDVLKYIYEHLDPGLAFRYSCRTEPCVVCSIRVNGKGVLSCCKVAEKVMRIEPPGEIYQSSKTLWLTLRSWIDAVRPNNKLKYYF